MTLSRENINLLEYLEFARSLAVEAGNLALDKWDTGFSTTAKGKRDIVTEVDVASQKLITSKIRRAYPTHGFITEEPDRNLPGVREITWVIDPIDGTINYSRHQNNFAVSIAVALNNKIKIGVIYDPVHQELFSALDGNGCYLNNSRVFPPKHSQKLEESIIGLDWSDSDQLRNATSFAIKKLANKVQTLSVHGTACLSLAWIALGRIDGYFNYGLDSWDIAAAYVLLKETNCKISLLSGTDWELLVTDKTLVASNPAIYEKLLEAIQLASEY